MGVGETQSLGCHAINVRRRDGRCAVTANVAVAQIIGVDQDDVGPVGGRGLRASCRQKKCHAEHSEASLIGLSAQHAEKSVGRVENQRSDVLVADVYGYITPELYAERPPDSPLAPETWMIRRYHRPVYYTTKKTERVLDAAIVQAGILYHLLPAGRPFDSAALLEQCTYRNLTSPTVLDLGACHILCDYHFFHAEAALGRGDRTTGAPA